MATPAYQSYGATAKDDQEKSGIRKAAVLMVSLDRATAATLMSQLDKEDIEVLSLAIAKLENVTSEEQDEIVEEYYQLNMARRYIDQGGIFFAEELLEKSLPPEQAKALIEQVKLALHGNPFSFLRKTPGDQLAQFLADEHPQTIAVVMAHLLPEKAAEVLGALPPSKQLDVTRRIAQMEQTSPEIVHELEEVLEHRLSAVYTSVSEDVGGAVTVAEMINFVDRNTEKAILEALEEEDPELVEEIRKLMFVFDDIERVDQRGMQEVLKEVQNDTLSLALKGASEDMQQKFFASMSERAGSLIKENMEYLGPVRISEVDRAQQEIVDIVRRLADAGTITVTERGVKDELIT